MKLKQPAIYALLIIALLLLSGTKSSLFAQEIADQVHWVWLSNKDNITYQLEQPGDFLSERSIQRRALQGLPVDERDLPVNENYLQQVRNLGVEIKHVSRWLNAFATEGTSAADYETIMALSFTDSLPWQPDSKSHYYPVPNGSPRFEDANPDHGVDQYWNAATQVEMTNTHLLHELGYTGAGVWIGVLDGGFYNVDSLPAFENMIAEGRLLEARNYVRETSIYREGSSHGMKVLSTMAAQYEDEMTGTAPHASYLLCMTENPDSETRMEEVAWIAAAEYADSLGIDLINTSLGYSEFDGEGKYDYSYEDLDGQSALISRAASLLASRGMVGCLSAGNSGSNAWYYITPPADATDVLTVGALWADETLAGFSSRGPTADARIKPDISNLGVQVAVQTTSGQVGLSNGTSFSSPLSCGSTASLWQAFPSLPANELIQMVRKSSDRFEYPDIEYGFGIPDFRRAYHMVTSLPGKKEEGEMRIWPNPTSAAFRLALPCHVSQEASLSVIDMQGREVLQLSWSEGQIISLPETLSEGIYIIKLHTANRIFRARLIKQ